MNPTPNPSPSDPPQPQALDLSPRPQHFSQTLASMGRMVLVHFREPGRVQNAKMARPAIVIDDPEIEDGFDGGIIQTVRVRMLTDDMADTGVPNTMTAKLYDPADPRQLTLVPKEPVWAEWPAFVPGGRTKQLTTVGGDTEGLSDRIKALAGGLSMAVDKIEALERETAVLAPVPGQLVHLSAALASTVQSLEVLRPLLPGSLEPWPEGARERFDGLGGHAVLSLRVSGLAFPGSLAHRPAPDTPAPTATPSPGDVGKTPKPIENLTTDAGPPPVPDRAPEPVPTTVDPSPTPG